MRLSAVVALSGESDLKQSLIACSAKSSSRSHRAVTVAFMRFSQGVEQVQVDAPASLGRRVG
jgi:hypothetical protein